MEKLDNYDGFWRDLVSKGSEEEKTKYLGDLIRNQTEQLLSKSYSELRYQVKI